MLGTIVNALAVILGGALGLVIKGGLKEKYKDIIMHGLAVSVLFLGMSSTLGGMFEENAEPLLFIVSLIIGSIVGTWLDLDQKLQNLGDNIQRRVGGSNVSQGFVTASLVFCVGSMAILGSLESGIKGDHTILFVKAVLDGTTAIIFASTLGVGVLISGVAIFVYQGTLTLLAGYIQPYLTDDMMREITIIGGMLIFMIGINLLELKKIKIANMLPALLVPVIYYTPFVQALFETAKGFMQ